MAHGDVREEKWRGNKRMKWVTSKRHMTAEDRLARAVQKPCRLMCVTRLPVFDWTDVPGRFKWTRPFRRKTKSGFCACAITFQMQSTTSWPCSKGLLQDRCLQVCNKLVCTCYRHSVAVIDTVLLLSTQCCCYRHSVAVIDTALLLDLYGNMFLPTFRKFSGQCFT